VATFVVFALCYTFLVRVRAYADTPRSELSETFALLENELRGQPVATVIPYNVIAYTTSAAVSIPINGEAAIDEVLRRYDIQWLLLLERPVPRRMFIDEPSDRLLVDIYRGRRTRLGSFAFDFAGTYPRGIRLFRVQRLEGASGGD
jgi:hypothetical protein